MKIDKQNEDLIVLIEQEKLPFHKFDHTNSLKFYCYYISKIIAETYHKLKEFENINIVEAIITGSNMIHHIFWVLISYTFNLQPTVFLVDRAILLYIQFIVMSRNPEMHTDTCYLPTINDALIFTYRKSIGPISAINLDNNAQLEKIRESSYLIKMIIQHVFIFLISPNENKKRENRDFGDTHENLEKKYLHKSIDMIINFLTNIIYQVHQLAHGNDKYIYSLILYLFTNLTENNLIYHIYLCKLFLIQIYNSYQNNIQENIQEKCFTVMDIMKHNNNFVYTYNPNFPELELPTNLTKKFKEIWELH
uniref:Uncharacterized protein n=1 Tax=viral metagenome TaxID=1070528 RepID=A0A6C0ECP0_9ZZZZ